jgi:glutamate/tyrosine decarboxylase-like PLP-dependent enzyme
LNEVSCRRVAPRAEEIAALERLGGPLPEQPTPAGDVLALLDEIGSPGTVANAGGRFFGFVNGGAVPASLAANVLAAAWDQNAGIRVSSPVGAVLEEIALGWVRQLFSLPPETGGALVTGATMANATCLVAARHSLLERKGWDVEARGLFGAPEFTVVIGEEAHASLKKAMAFVGLGRERVHIVPADGQGRMRAADFPHLKEPALVCLQAGNVNTGAFDPADELCRLAHESGSRVHVDGAFGLWAACAPERKHLTVGYEDADSWATDGHKWLNVPYDCGLAFVRDGNALRSALSLEAAYLAASSLREPMHWTPESSRRARGVEVWAAIKSLGAAGIADLVERTCRHAQRFASALTGRVRDYQRRGNQPGDGFLRKRRSNPSRDGGNSTGRNLLVWWDGVARTHGDAHQCLLLGNHRCGRGTEHCGNPECCPRSWSSWIGSAGIIRCLLTAANAAWRRRDPSNTDVKCLGSETMRTSQNAASGPLNNAQTAGIVGHHVWRWPARIQAMARALTADDILQLVDSLPPRERVRLQRLIAMPQGGDASVYRSVPPSRDEFSADDEPLAWDAEGWEDIG